MRNTTRQQRVYYFCLVVFSLYGIIVAIDPSPDNHFYIRGLLDISNLWLGVGTLGCVALALWRKPKLWNLHNYFVFPMFISLQRCIMIILDPARAKVALPIYLMAWGFLALTEWEEWKNSANTTATN